MKALILGCGLSGKAAESYLQGKGFETVIYDDGPPPSLRPPETRPRRALPLEVLHGTPKARPAGGREQGAVVNTSKRLRPLPPGILHKDHKSAPAAAEHGLAAKHPDADVGTFGGRIPDGQFDFCVISPGISYSHEAVQKMLERDIPVIAEFELPFFLSDMKTSIVAVTGTNGKTTVVNQIHSALIGSGKKSVLCGNVGTPLSALAEELRGAVAVAEISSFMLEPAAKRVKHLMPFCPHIAVITNITQDHLERHGTMDEYRRCKEQIFANQRRRDWLVLNYDDPHCRSIGQMVADRRKTKRRAGAPNVLWFSVLNRVRGFYCDGGTVYNNTGRKAKPLFSLTEAAEDTPHGSSNLLAAVCVGYLLKLKSAAVLAAVKAVNRPNRIEPIGEKNGIVFYNDSKSTNTASALAACNCFSLPVVLIMCGLTKGQNYDGFFERLPKNVSNIVVFGACAAAVAESAEKTNYTNITVVADLPSAVSEAAEKAAPAGVVLFSPGGSSFDMFENYEDRGEKFRQCVKKYL